MHIQNIFADGELEEKSVSKKFLLTASDGKSYNINYYNLDMIISVGYRVNSDKAIQFRRWATNVLKQFAKKVILLTKKVWKMEHFLMKIIFKNYLQK